MRVPITAFYFCAFSKKKKKKNGNPKNFFNFLIERRKVVEKGSVFIVW